LGGLPANALDCVTNAVFRELIEDTMVAADTDPTAIAAVHGLIAGAEGTDPNNVHCAWADIAENAISASAAAAVIVCFPPTPHAGTVNLR
jgi:hypothetical protein